MSLSNRQLFSAWTITIYVPYLRQIFVQLCWQRWAITWSFAWQILARILTCWPKHTKHAPMSLNECMLVLVSVTMEINCFALSFMATRDGNLLCSCFGESWWESLCCCSWRLVTRIRHAIVLSWLVTRIFVWLFMTTYDENLCVVHGDLWREPCAVVHGDPWREPLCRCSWRHVTRTSVLLYMATCE